MCINFYLYLSVCMSVYHLSINVIVNCMHQLDRATGYPDVWLNGFHEQICENDSRV